MAWCRLTTSDYLNQCWLRSMLPGGVTRLQWIDLSILCLGPIWQSFKVFISTKSNFEKKTKCFLLVVKLRSDHSTAVVMYTALWYPWSDDWIWFWESQLKQIQCSQHVSSQTLCERDPLIKYKLCYKQNPWYHIYIQSLFLDCNTSLNSPMTTKWCTKLEVAWKRCPIVLQPVIRQISRSLGSKNSRIWPKLGVYGL